MDYDRTPVSVALFDATRSSRRRLLRRLAALPAAIGLGFFIEPKSVAARKHNGQRKKRKHRGNKKNDKNRGGGGGYRLTGKSAPSST